MTDQGLRSGAGFSRSSVLAVLLSSVLVLLLPTLVVGASIGEPAQPDELARLQRIVQQQPLSRGLDTSGSRLFHRAAVSMPTWPQDPKAAHLLVVKARLMQLFGVTAVAFLTYLSVLLAGGRVQALLACAAITLLPPVLQAGYVLRPETPATLFALMSLVLLQVASRPAPHHRFRHPQRSLLVGCGLMLCSAVAAAVACETMPSFGVILLLPGAVLLIATLQLSVRGVRCHRRRGLPGTPIRSINLRLMPWTAMALVTPAITWCLLRFSRTMSAEALAAPARTSSLLPEGMIGYTLTVVVLLIGLVVGVLRVGFGLSKRGRIGPSLILLVYCAVTLASGFAVERFGDPLPMLPAVAVLLSEGLRAILILVSGAVSPNRIR